MRETHLVVEMNEGSEFDHVMNGKPLVVYVEGKD